MILIFEGVDKTGKTTLIEEFNRRTKYSDIAIIDRGTAGYTTYDTIFKRDNNHIRTELDLYRTNCLVIYCKSSIEDIRKRLKEHNEEEPKDLEKTIREYEKNINNLRVPNLEVNTSKSSIHECVSLIISTIEDIKTESKYLNLKHKFSYNDVEFDYIEYFPSFNTYDNNTLKKLSVLYDKEVDKPYYEMLEKSLDHVIHKQKLNLINNRQMIYNSNDCISLIQIVKCSAYKNAVNYEIIIHQRSLDFEKHGLNDLLCIYTWFNKHCISSDIVLYHYNIAVPHRYIRERYKN